MNTSSNCKSKNVQNQVQNLLNSKLFSFQLLPNIYASHVVTGDKEWLENIPVQISMYHKINYKGYSDGKKWFYSCTKSINNDNKNDSF